MGLTILQCHLYSYNAHLSIYIWIVQWIHNSKLVLLLQLEVKHQVLTSCSCQQSSLLWFYCCCWLSSLLGRNRFSSIEISSWFVARLHSVCEEFFKFCQLFTYNFDYSQLLHVQTSIVQCWQRKLGEWIEVQLRIRAFKYCCEEKYWLVHQTPNEYIQMCIDKMYRGWVRNFLLFRSSVCELIIIRPTLRNGLIAVWRAIFAIVIILLANYHR